MLFNIYILYNIHFAQVTACTGNNVACRYKTIILANVDFKSSVPTVAQLGF